MKTNFFTYAILFLTVIGIGSCSTSDTMPTTTTTTFLATINGASEVPVNSSMAAGTASFTYNTTTYILTGTVTFSGITATGAHIHKGAAGVSGDVIFPLGSAPVTSPISFTSVALNATQRADLMANLYYVNIHSTAFPGGEIRGQLIKKVGTGGGGTGGGGY